VGKVEGIKLDLARPVWKTKAPENPVLFSSEDWQI